MTNQDKSYPLGKGSEADAPRATAEVKKDEIVDPQWPASGPWHNPFEHKPPTESKDKPVTKQPETKK